MCEYFPYQRKAHVQRTGAGKRTLTVYTGKVLDPIIKNAEHGSGDRDDESKKPRVFNEMYASVVRIMCVPRINSSHRMMDALAQCGFFPDLRFSDVK